MFIQFDLRDDVKETVNPMFTLYKLPTVRERGECLVNWPFKSMSYTKFENSILNNICYVILNKP